LLRSKFLTIKSLGENENTTILEKNENVSLLEKLLLFFFKSEE